MTLPIFVISLARSEARRRATIERLAAFDLRAEIVDAVDSSMPAGLQPGSSQVSPLLTIREQACLRSHCAVYDRIERDALPVACILEDDCAFSRTLPRVLEYVARGASGWDVLLLGHHSSRHDAAAGAETCYRTLAKGEGFRVARVAEFPMGAYAYVVTFDGARALRGYARPPRMPVDWVVGYSPAAGVRLGAVTPPCATPDPSLASPTTIDDRRAAEPAGPSSWRGWIGAAALQLRKAGFRPGGYASHAGSKMQP